jgi:DNA-binding MarR family transcriptional regulator
MAGLVANDAMDFTTLKHLLNLTDGNLASHIAALESEGYVKVRKAFIGKKPSTTYMLTAAGRKAFAEHVDALEKLIKHTS